MFIAFEGIDGSGKTTLSKALAKFLISKGIKTLWTKEPFNNQLKDFVLRNPLSPWEETLLFITDRSLHIREVIKPYLEKGFTVITDRFYLSTLAYQGFGKGIPVEEIKKIHTTVIGNIKPDITFLLDLEPQIALERLKNREETLTKFEKIEFLEKVRKGFLKLAEEEPNIYLLKGDKPFYELLGNVIKILYKKISQGKA